MSKAVQLICRCCLELTGIVKMKSAGLWKKHKGKIETEVDWGKRIMIGLIRMHFIISISSSD